MSRYDVQSIRSSNLPICCVTNKSKTSESSSSSSDNKKIRGKHLINGVDDGTFEAPTSFLKFALPPLNLTAMITAGRPCRATK